MGSFFKPPPPPPEPPKRGRLWEPRDWDGPPSNVLGTSIALRAILVHTTELLIAVVEASVYPVGVAFKLVIRVGSESATQTVDETQEMEFRSRRQLVDGGGLSDSLLRFGVICADGSTASSVDSDVRFRPPLDLDAPPVVRVLTSSGGGGGGGEWQYSYWLWPLPPEGQLTFVCEWPMLGVEETRVSVDASPLQAAAREAITLWPRVPSEY